MEKFISNPYSMMRRSNLKKWILTCYGGKQQMKMQRCRTAGIVFCLLLFLFSGCSKEVNVQETETTAEAWEKAYTEVLCGIEETLGNSTLREEKNAYPIRKIWLFLYDLNQSGIPELIVGDNYDVDIYAYQDGDAKKIACFSEMSGNDSITGIALYNDCICFSGSQYWLFGFFDGAYHILSSTSTSGTIDGEPMTYAEIWNYFPRAIYEGAYVIQFDDDDWILNQYNIRNEDGEIFLDSVWDFDDAEDQKPDFAQLWEPCEGESRAREEAAVQPSELTNAKEAEEFGQEWYAAYTAEVYRYEYLLPDLDGEGVPEFAYGDAQTVHVCTMRQGTKEELAVLEMPEGDTITGIAYSNGCLYLVHAEYYGNLPRKYLMFGYFDGAYHTVYDTEFSDGTLDGTPITYEQGLRYFPHVLQEGAYVWKIEDSDWIIGN
jgi:hypothetical protein